MAKRISKAVAKTASAALPAPVTDNANGIGPASVDFTSGSDGKGPRLAWARYQINPMSGPNSPYVAGASMWANRERNIASAIAYDLATSSPVLATLIENLTTHNVGPNGLTLSSKIDGDSIGITPDEARKLSSQIEKKWKTWAESPLEVDLSGRASLHDLAATAFRTWLITGEIVAVMEWVRCRGALTKTKVNLLLSAQLDQSKTMTGPGTCRTVSGVVFDHMGRVAGYYIIPHVLGQQANAPQPVLVPAYTSWGRQKVAHIFMSNIPGTVRGVSPLAAALTPSQEKATLGEFTLDAALLQTMYALTIESDLPPMQALNGLAVNDAMSMPNDHIAIRGEWYKQAKVQPQPGVINHLAPGDKLKINRSETPNSTYDPFTRDLSRQASKAAGSSYEDVSGDYSQTSFSASRLAAETPHRINLRRRNAITGRFYQSVFNCWLEEQIETGAIELPKSAKPFHAVKDAYTSAKWLGIGRVVADPYKAAMADVLELENGLATHAEVLGQRGIDFETFIEERKAELKMLREAGILEPSTPGNVVTQIRENEDGEADQGDQGEAVPLKPQRRKGTR